jgi:hypothetical protein
MSFYEYQQINFAPQFLYLPGHFEGHQGTVTVAAQPDRSIWTSLEQIADAISGHGLDGVRDRAPVEPVWHKGEKWLIVAQEPRQIAAIEPSTPPLTVKEKERWLGTPGLNRHNWRSDLSPLSPEHRTCQVLNRGGGKKARVGKTYSRSSLDLGHHAYCEEGVTP